MQQLEYQTFDWTMDGCTLFPFDKKLYSILFPSDPREILGVFTLQWTSVPSRQEYPYS